MLVYAACSINIYTENKITEKYQLKRNFFQITKSYNFLFDVCARCAYVYLKLFSLLLLAHSSPHSVSFHSSWIGRIESAVLGTSLLLFFPSQIDNTIFFPIRKLFTLLKCLLIFFSSSRLFFNSLARPLPLPSTECSLPIVMLLLLLLLLYLFLSLAHLLFSDV